jgi:hypothetical protein
VPSNSQIDIYTQETEELNAHVELLERGLDSESQLQYQRILELRPELEQLCKQSAGLETKCNHQRHQNENLEVDWADEVPVGDTV